MRRISGKHLTRLNTQVVRIGIVAAVVMSTALVAAVPAHADNATDFLDMLSADGVNIGATPEDVELTLSAGQLVCHLLHDGFSTQIATRQMRYSFPDATSGQLEGIVEAAQTKLCAQAYTPLQPGDW